MAGIRSAVLGPALGALMFAPLVQGDQFADALAACARVTAFCEDVSYDEERCSQAEEGLADCGPLTAEGTLCKLRLKDIAPGQVAVGVHAADCKAKAKFDRKKRKIVEYLVRANHHVPTVIGPKNGAGKRYYITDHHHLTYALHRANEKGYTDVDTVYACILGNRKEEGVGEFWDFMVGNHFTWLDDENGRVLTPDQLEKRAPDLADMKDDPFRTWSRWVRDSCGYVKAGNDCVPESYPADAAYFMEFKWADFLERNLPQDADIGSMKDAEIGKKLQEAVALAQGPQAFLEDLPGYSDGSVVEVRYVEIENGCEKD